MKNLKPNWQNGLTLVETLVAITILIVGVLGPLEIAARGIGDGLFARNQIAANYLAQEALEVIINKRYALVREAQYSPPASPNTIFDVNPQFSNCLAAGVLCQVDPVAGTIVIDGAGDGVPLIYNIDAGLYKDASQPGNKSGPIFTRKIKLERMGGSAPTDEIKVTVEIDWHNKDVPKNLTIVEHLFSKG